MPFGSGLEIEESSTGSLVTKCRPTVVCRYHRSKGFETDYISHIHAEGERGHLLLFIPVLGVDRNHPAKSELGLGKLWSVY